MKKIMLAAVATIYLAAAGYAGEGFDLNSISLADLNGADNAAAVPVPAEPVQAPTKAPNMPAPALDMSITLPFAELNKRLAEISDQVQALDPAAPVLSREGDYLALRNISVNINGIEAEPVILFKPWFEGKNSLAIKFLKVEVNIAFGPKAAGLPRLDKNEVMAFVVEKMTAGILATMNTAFAKNNVPMKAKDVLSFNYDKVSWTLRAAISPKIAAPLLPGLLTDINLTAFSFDDKGFTLSVKSGSGADIAQLSGCNLALSDGLLTNFLLRYTKDTDFDLKPRGSDGGVKFRADGRLELAGKIYARDIFLKPDVYFTVTVLPALTGPNTLKIYFERIEIDKAYGIGLPGFINNWLQNKIITSVVEGVSGNKALAKVMKARKLDDRTIELKMENTAFLPSFAQGVNITGLRLAQGLLCLGFEF
ncbi:MAG: hypothetical protein KKH28_02565 [Elusimicrobia bacterium]|nr:hypothetical protein [Elusimicrobiota bacterium]